ncbi:MAG TPA: IclR family transcriptional regulator C-terminal domain-containing protein [Pseudonocardia sp.]|nr:IclR family transcriptional regulator C-terminal domain-containing protein [Pseudonocardia sp.]
MSHRLEPPPRSAVSRITAILSTFLTGRSHSVTEMARMTGLPVSTTHRIAVDLASWQLLHRSSDGRYRVGIILRQLGGKAWSMPLLTERGPHVVTDLCEATRRRARLGVLVNGRVRYIERRAGADPATSFTDSATLPAHATALGKALLAFAPSEAVAQALTQLTAYTPNTVHTLDRLQRALGIVRLTRSALARGELVVGECAVAVPVFGCGGEVVAALELELHDVRADLDTCRAALTVAARGLSREVAVDHDPADRPRLRLLPAANGAAVPVP